MAVCARQDSFVGEKHFEHIDVGFVRAPAYQSILVGSRSFVTVDPGRESSFGERSVFERKVNFYRTRRRRVLRLVTGYTKIDFSFYLLCKFE